MKDFLMLIGSEDGLQMCLETRTIPRTEEYPQNEEIAEAHEEGFVRLAHL